MSLGEQAAAREEVRALLTDLAWSLDTGEADRFARAFAADAEFVLETPAGPVRIAGRAALVADFRARRGQGVTGQHRFSNHLFAEESSAACTVWSYWSTTAGSTPPDGFAVTASGWLCDRLRRGSDGWLIEHHHLGLWGDDVAHPLVRTACC